MIKEIKPIYTIGKTNYHFGTENKTWMERIGRITSYIGNTRNIYVHLFGGCYGNKKTYICLFGSG